MTPRRASAHKVNVIHIGVAGWSIPKAVADSFPSDGSHLARYARRFSGVEINSTFYRVHRAPTYERWAASVSAHFRFAVKAPRTITHDKRLSGVAALLDAFLDQIAALGDKLGPVLVQLPPSLPCEKRTAAAFFRRFRKVFAGAIACEPRHGSWFTPEGDTLLADFGVARVAADPAKVAAAAAPGGARDFTYWRLHGSPRMYYSPYSSDYIAALARRLKDEAPRAQWCIFDNTASGAATQNALDLLARVNQIPTRGVKTSQEALMARKPAARHFPPRHFKVHVRGHPEHACTVDEGSMEAAAVTFLERMHLPDGDVAVIVQEVGHGHPCCFMIDAGTGEVVPCRPAGGR